MGFGQRWPARIRRPKARTLTDTEQAAIMRSLEKGIAASPVLSAFGTRGMGWKQRSFAYP